MQILHNLSQRRSEELDYLDNGLPKTIPVVSELQCQEMCKTREQHDTTPYIGQIHQIDHLDHQLPF